MRAVAPNEAAPRSSLARSEPLPPPLIGAGVPDVRISALLIDPATISSVALRRLVEEVRNETPRRRDMYDRIHNRHNR